MRPNLTTIFVKYYAILRSLLFSYSFFIPIFQPVLLSFTIFPIGKLLKNIDLKIIPIIPSYSPLIRGAERQLGRLSKIQSIENEVIIITRNLVNKNPLYRKKINQKLEILRFGFGDLIINNIILFFYLFLNRPNFLHIHTLTSPFFISCIYAFLFKSKIIAKLPDTELVVRLN